MHPFNPGSLVGLPGTPPPDAPPTGQAGPELDGSGLAEADRYVGEVLELAGRFALVVAVSELGVRVAWLDDVTDPVDLAELVPAPPLED